MTHLVLLTGATRFISSAVVVSLLDFVAALECEVIQHLVPMQPGDVKATAADTTALEAWVSFRPVTPMGKGVTAFADWYCQFYGC